MSQGRSALTQLCHSGHSTGSGTGREWRCLAPMRPEGAEGEDEEEIEDGAEGGAEGICEEIINAEDATLEYGLRTLDCLGK